MVIILFNYFYFVKINLQYSCSCIFHVDSAVWISRVFRRNAAQAQFEDGKILSIFVPFSCILW